MIAAALVLVVASPPCIDSGGRPWSRAEAEVRVAEVRALVAREHAAFRAWRAGWVAVLGVGVAGQAWWANARMTNGERAALLVGAAKAAVGVVAVATMPEPDPPADWGGDTCERLRVAEAALAQLAVAQAASTAVWRHVGSVLLNVAATVFVGAVYDDWLSATASGLLGLAVGQAILRSRPDDAHVALTAGPGGIGLVVRF